MKTQSITFGLLLFALSLTSCKNTETPATEKSSNEVAASAADSAPILQVTTTKESLKSTEKNGKEEKE